VVLAFNLPLSLQPATTAHFSDVPASNPFFGYVEAVYARGLVSGYSNGTFRPYNSITRGQLSKMVVQAAGYSLMDPVTPTFADVPRSSTFHTYIETAYANGMLGGYSDGMTVALP
jgi:competence protein ComEC